MLDELSSGQLCVEPLSEVSVYRLTCERQSGIYVVGAELDPLSMGRLRAYSCSGQGGRFAFPSLIVSRFTNAVIGLLQLDAFSGTPLAVRLLSEEAGTRTDHPAS